MSSPNSSPQISTSLAPLCDIPYNSQTQGVVHLRSAPESQNDPITRNLPLELSAHVFQLHVDSCSEGSRLFKNEWEMDTVLASAPLQLGAVCRRWRSIAWSSPRLWTTLRINLVADGHEYGPELVQQWFERAGSLPVSVELFERHETIFGLEGSSKENAERVMGVLNTFFSRINYIDLQGIPFDIISLLRAPKSGPSPVLQYLAIGGLDLEDEDLIESWDDEVSTAIFAGYDPPPNPSYLKLRSRIPLHRLNIDWTCLIDLRLENISRILAFQIISTSARTLKVVDLQEINGYSDEDDVWRPSHMVELPCVVSLSFSDMDSSMGSAEVLFEQYSFPSLESLSYYGDTHDMPTEAMVSCIRRSSCSLKKLVMYKPKCENVAQLITLLREMPELRRLTVSLGEATCVEPLLEMLHIEGEAPQLFLPHLCRLNFTACPTFSWTSLANMWLSHRSLHTEHPSKSDTYTIHPYRKKLAVSLKIQDNIGRAAYIPWTALSALLAIFQQTDKGVAVSQVDTRRKQCTPSSSTSNLLLDSLRHHLSHNAFPAT